MTVHKLDSSTCRTASTSIPHVLSLRDNIVMPHASPTSSTPLLPGTMPSHAEGAQWPREILIADIKPRPTPRFCWAGLKRDISKDHTDIPIIACCFTSGLCDSSAYNVWNTFVSMQTGMPYSHNMIPLSTFGRCIVTSIVNERSPFFSLLLLLPAQHQSNAC